MADERHPTPADETRRLYEEAETRTARAFEHLVSRDSFGELLARVTENTVALTKIGTDALDLTLRNLRLDAPQGDAVSLPLGQAPPPGAGAAGVRADQPAGHLRPAPGQLVRRVPAR